MPLSKPCCPGDANAVKRERRKQARPGELLDAALGLFVEKGFAATRAEEVAARAGVSKGTLFLYFDSKEELFKAVVREHISGCIHEWREGVASFTGTSAELLSQCMRFWWARHGATASSGIVKLIISESKNFPELAEFYRQEVTQPGHAAIRQILQRGVASGEFRPMPVDQVVYQVVAAMTFLILSQHTPGLCLQNADALEPQAFIAQQLDTLLRGIAAAAPAPAPP